MKDESKEMLNDNLLIKARADSYMRKEELIKIIEQLRFDYVERIRLEVITRFKISLADNNKKRVDNLGYTIEIE